MNQIVYGLPVYVWVCFVAFCVGFFCLGCWLVSRQKEVERRNLEHSKQVAADLVAQARMEGRLQFIDDNTMQFVQILCGHVPGEHRVWARVTTSKTVLSVRIECWYLADFTQRHYAQTIVEALTKQGTQATLIMSAPQPDPNQVYPPIEKCPVEPEDNPNRLW